MLELSNKNILLDYLKANKLWLRRESGQHFLVDQATLDAIIQAAELKKDDTVLEIGPGVGTLTHALVNVISNGLVLSVEKDYRFVELLRKKFKGAKQVKIVHEDIIQFLNSHDRLGHSDPASAGEESNSPKLLNFKVVANLPYQISGYILREFLGIESDYSPKMLVLMLQKEVAERLVAMPGSSDRGILTIIRELFGEAEIIKQVSKTSFFPVPAVDSAVIKIVKYPKEKQLSKEVSQSVIWLAKIGFASKRRTLANNLSGSLRLNKSEVEKELQKLSIAPLARAEDLSLDNWVKLARAIRSFTTLRQDGVSSG